MDPTPFYGARAEKKSKKADFAMKQTNICRLSGDIMNQSDIHIVTYMYRNMNFVVTLTVTQAVA